MKKDVNKTNPERIWRQHEIQADTVREWQVGPLCIWCKKSEKEIQIAYRQSEDEQAGNQNPENLDDLKWIRWALEKKQDKIELLPVLPDRPLVVKPESSFWLTRNIKANIYVRVPVWIQINLAGRRKAKPLMEIPSVRLSNTWFGDFFEGELSYWISTGAQREVEVDTQPHLIICPVQLVNGSDEDLLVEKICLRVSTLSIFLSQGRLWTDMNKIVYKGSSDVSQVQATGSAPAEAQSAELLALPRSPHKKNLVAKTFSSIKDLPGLGIPTN